MMNSTPKKHPARKRFYSEIPWGDKARREANTASFRKTERGTYSITKGGKKIWVKAEPWDRDDSFGVAFSTENGHIIGEFGITKEIGDQTIYHRKISDGYKGYNLGKLGFRLMEQQAINRKVKAIVFDAGQTEVIVTALSLGYSPDPRSEQVLKLALRIPRLDPLPPTQELMRLMQQKNFHENLPRVTLRKVLQTENK